MSEISILKATAEPDDLKLVSPKIAQPEVPFIKRVFPDQSWSTVQALNFIMNHENDLRDNALLADMIATSISRSIESVTQDQLDILYSASNVRRETIDLDPIEEDTYKNQRDPGLLRGFVLEVLEALGLEQDISEDVVDAAPDDRVVAISDEDVADERKSGSASDVEARAEIIAKKLGLEYVPHDTNGKNLVVPSVYITDSTDSYVKKVIK